MKKFTIYAATSVALLTLLVACGGGGSSTPAQTPVVADVTDKYVGTWTVCVPNAPAASVGATKEVINWKKTSATVATYDFTQTSYANTTCAGTPTSTNTSTGTDTFVGTKLIGSTSVDKISVIDSTAPTTTLKGISTVVGNLLKTGDGNSPLDAEGYPTALDTVYIYTKQ